MARAASGTSRTSPSTSSAHGRGRRRTPGSCARRTAPCLRAAYRAVHGADRGDVMNRNGDARKPIRLTELTWSSAKGEQDAADAELGDDRVGPGAAPA